MNQVCHLEDPPVETAEKVGLSFCVDQKTSTRLSTIDIRRYLLPIKGSREEPKNSMEKMQSIWY